jgi:hypothetical protein
MPSFWKNAFRLKEYVPFEKIPSVRCVLLERMRSVCKYAFHVKVKKKKKTFAKKEHVLFRTCSFPSLYRTQFLSLGMRSALVCSANRNTTWCEIWKAFQKSEGLPKIGTRSENRKACSVWRGSVPEQNMFLLWRGLPIQVAIKIQKAFFWNVIQNPVFSFFVDSKRMPSEKRHVCERTWLV